jgi:site-specific recombinase XerD
MSKPIPLTDELAIAWIAWCRNEHIPVNTIARRVATLRSIGNAGEATREDVEAWWAARTGLAPSSRSNDLACLRSFYKWVRRWEYRVDDPTLRIDAPHVPVGLPHPMSKPNLHLALDTFPPDLRRAVCMGAYAGLRISEAAAIDWAEIDAEARTIHVLHGKGNKERLFAINTILIDQLLPDVGGNVVTAGHGAYTAATLQRRVNRAFRRAGIGGTFHALRHRFGTIGYQASGGDLLALGKMMGHASPVTTAIYADPSNDVSVKIAAAVVR